MKKSKWHVVASETIYTDKWLTLRKDVCELPNGIVINDYMALELPDGAVIVATTQNREIILVEQYKHGYGEQVLELPAGYVEKDENSTEGIKRELAEETGFHVHTVEYISKIVSKPGRMKAVTHVYFAQGLTNQGETKFDKQEDISIRIVPLSDLKVLLGGSNMITETSLAALLLVWDRLF